MMDLHDWLTPTERRLKLIAYLCNKRFATMNSLAEVFGVSTRTIRRDIEYLTLSYPIETLRGRYDGGVKVRQDYYLNQRYLSTKQIDLLEKIKECLPTREVVVIDSILEEFTLCNKQK